jgi:hypothetical protein
MDRNNPFEGTVKLPDYSAKPASSARLALAYRIEPHLFTKRSPPNCARR